MGHRRLMIASVLSAACLDLAAAQDEELVWDTVVGEGVVSLMYGQPRTDYVPLSLTCNTQSGTGELSLQTDAVGLEAGERGPIVMAGPVNRRDVDGEAYWNEMLEGVQMGANLTALAGAVAALEGTGTLRVELPGVSMELPLDVAAAAAVAAFKQECPSAE